MNQLSRTNLFLRTDGSLMLAQGDVAIEAHLTPAQLLQLGVDALRTAVTIDDRLMEAACVALERTQILPTEPTCPSRVN